MAGIDFSKFSDNFKKLWDEAIKDKKVTLEEFAKFSPDDQKKLTELLAGDSKSVGKVDVVQVKYTNETDSLELFWGKPREGKVDISAAIKKKYKGADSGWFKDGILRLKDASGNFLTDAAGKPIEIKFEEAVPQVETDVEGGFEEIENEDFMRTNRRFAVAFIETMYNKKIKECSDYLRGLGALDMGFWRESLGMGLQVIADIVKDQKAITASTSKEIERMISEKNNITDNLNALLDSPNEFASKFQELTGCAYQNMNFENLREMCFDTEKEKNSNIRYNKCVEEFKKLYPDNRVTKYLDFDHSVSKFCDGVADIIVMFMMTGGIGKITQILGSKSIAAIGEQLLQATAKGNIKEVLSQMPKFMNLVKSAMKTNPVQFAKNFATGAATSSATMATYEGGKTLVNGLTNAEDLTTEELIHRTLESVKGGAEMGVEMTVLQAFAIGPIMNKLSPLLSKMTGAAPKVSQILAEGGKKGASMADIMKAYEDCAATTRGIIAKEGLHLGVTLPTFVVGFTGIDSAKAFLAGDENPQAYNSENFRRTLLEQATSPEERDEISAMSDMELRVEFVKQNFMAQLEGMATIEGLSLAMRRYQAARLAKQDVPKGIPDLLGARMYEVKKDEKTYYELRDANGKVISIDKGDGKKVNKFATQERATAAYQALCLNILSNIQTEILSDNTENTQRKGIVLEGGVRSDELTEVAPFAQRLTNTPDVKDLTNPEIKEVKLESGKYNEQGEFIPDDIYVKTETANPLAKKSTYKKYADGREVQLPRTEKELENYFEELNGGIKLSPSEQEKIRNFVAEHSDMSIQEIAEILSDYNHAMHAQYRSTDDFLFGYEGFFYIKDLKTFKANIKEFDKFVTELVTNNSENPLLRRIYGWRSEYFSKDMSEISPEEFKKNIEYCKTLDEITQSGLLKYNYDFLLKPHSEKEFANMDIAKEYNRFALEHNSKQDCKVDMPFLNIESVMRYSDEMVAQLKKNIELVKKLAAKETRGISLHDVLDANDSSTTDLFERMQTELGEEFDYRFFAMMKQGYWAKSEYDIPIKLMKNCPQSMLQMNYWDYSLPSVYYGLSEAGKKNFVDKVEILSKMPKLIETEKEGGDPYSLKAFLTEENIPHAGKILEFIEIADPNYLSKIRFSTRYNAVFDFAKIFNPETINKKIECAKLHSKLPEEFRKYLASKESIIGRNKEGYNSADECNYQYNIEPEELAKRIEVINKYQGKLPPDILENIYNGSFVATDAVYDLFTQLDPVLTRELVNYNNTVFTSLSAEAAEKFVTFVRNSNITKEDAREFARNYRYAERLSLFEKLSAEELDALPFNEIAHLSSELYEYQINEMKKVINRTPKKVRDLIKKDIGLGFYADFNKTSNNSTYDKLVAELDKMSEADLANIGAKTIIEYLGQSGYGDGFSTFNPVSLEKWKTVSQDVKDKLGERAFVILTQKEGFDLNDLNSKVDKLKAYGVFEFIEGRCLSNVLMNTNSGMTECLDLILKDENFEGKNINQLVYSLQGLKSHELEEWGYVKELINDERIDKNYIGTILCSLSFENAGRENQKVFLKYCLERGDIEMETICDILRQIDGTEYNRQRGKRFLKPIVKITTELAKELFDNPNINKGDIGRIIYNIEIATDNTNFVLAKRLCTDKKLDFPKDKIAEVLHATQEYNISLAERLCTDKELDFPKDKIVTILEATREYNISLSERLCTDKELDLPKDKIVDLLSYANTRDKADSVDSILQSEELRGWFYTNLKNGISYDSAVNLARTQKTLFAEAKRHDAIAQIQARKEAARALQQQNAAKTSEVSVSPEALVTITETLGKLDVPENMASKAYAKFCIDSNGNVDRVKLNALSALIKAYGVERSINQKGKEKISVNISPKDIADIFKLAIGDSFSNANGVFREQMINDIIALKQAGIDDIKFAMKLSAIKNMGEMEMKARLDGNLRKELADKISKIDSATKERLKSQGIDVDSIRTKSLTEPKGAKVLKDVPQQVVHRRALDSIVGTERLVLDKFKSDPEVSQIWSDEAAFKRWAEKHLEQISNWDKNDYKSIQYEQYNDARKQGLKDWVEFLNSEQCSVKDDVFAKLLFLDGIVSEMKPDNAYTPPSISPETFEAVYNQILEGNTKVSITKAYAEINRQKAIKQFGQPTTASDGTEGTWVRIPSGGKRGEPEYDEHIAMIQSLAEGSAWCLRFENAHGYLQQGDIHFFVDKNGKSQMAIGVRKDGSIFEMQRRDVQDGTVPVNLANVVNEWAVANKVTGRERAIQTALNAKPEFDKKKAKFTELQNNGDIVGIFNALGIKTEILPDGTLSISHYQATIQGQPYSVFDLGINENFLFSNVSEVKGYMQLKNSALTKAPKLRQVTGKLDFGDNKVSDLRSLESIDGIKIEWVKP